MPSIKSLYVAILLVMLVVLSGCFIAFRSISNRAVRLDFMPVLSEMDQLEIESARAALSQGGTAAVSAYMRQLDSVFGGSHYLLDEHGVDIVSGANHEGLLPRPPATQSREQRGNNLVLTHRSDDGRYWVVAVWWPPTGKSHPWIFLPYYLWVAGVITLLCWLTAVGVLSPIRQISKTAASFGRGELTARVMTRRQDEIGQLAQSFNQMADRVEGLITSERRLLGDISHELRSPLSRLKLATKLARTSLDQQSALDRIERDVDRMSSLVGDIVEITRMESDPSPRDMTPLKLNSLIEAIVDDCRIEAETRGCSLAVAGHVASEIEGNRELLRRAIENVVRNAIHYSPAKAVVDVLLKEEPGTATIEVRDRGPGVPEESLARIFEPFFRIEEARDKVRGGSGLGLSIANRAIQLHHGSIVAENAAPGLKVAMSIPLPKAKEP
jgi:signal transduction histidine kinase